MVRGTPDYSRDDLLRVIAEQALEIHRLQIKVYELLDELMGQEESHDGL
jgi:hypothetical protein